MRNGDGETLIPFPSLIDHFHTFPLFLSPFLFIESASNKHHTVATYIEQTKIFNNTTALVSNSIPKTIKQTKTLLNTTKN